MKDSDVVKALGLRLAEAPSIGVIVHQNKNYDIEPPYLLTQVVRGNATDETLSGGAQKDEGYFQVSALTSLGEFELPGLVLADKVKARFPYGLRLPLESGGHLLINSPPFTQTGYDDGVYWRTIVKIEYVAMGEDLFGAFVPAPPVIAGDSAPYVFAQPAPSSLWIVNHNLGWTPQVTVLSLGGAEIDAAVNHTSLNQFTVTFNTAQAGSAVYE